MYIAVLNVAYDYVYMYKSLQIKCMFCSVLCNMVALEHYTNNDKQFNRHQFLINFSKVDVLFVATFKIGKKYLLKKEESQPLTASHVNHCKHEGY